MRALATVLGIGWGALAAAPLARHARRLEVSTRLAARTPISHQPRRATTAWLRRLATEAAANAMGRAVIGIVQRRGSRQREATLARELPVAIDLLAVAVGAGCTPYLAVGVAAQWSPPALADPLDGVRRDCALGVSFAAALDRATREHTSLESLVDALLASERYGAPVGDALTRLAGEERAAIRRRAEARARTVPVRMLFPLVFLVLPAFGLLSVVPVLLTGLSTT